VNDPATRTGITGLTGRRALVTGGTAGIGGATAAALIRVGCEVTVTARGVPQHLDPDVAFVQADVSRSEDTERLVQVVSGLGPVDIVVNPVGGSSAPAVTVWELTDGGMAA
jgi:NAD(P)-dependent dehydrogenase (short-subunit alcohol dehydrogenase family)